jgi:hypothetical protein
MKQRILKVMMALGALCLYIQLSPPLLENTKLAWMNWQSLTGRNNFYFRKRQWLADARTIAAAIQYLYESRKDSQINPTDVVIVPHALPLRPEISTNQSRIERT